MKVTPQATQRNTAVRFRSPIRATLATACEGVNDPWNVDGPTAGGLAMGPDAQPRQQGVVNYGSDNLSPHETLWITLTIPSGIASTLSTVSSPKIIL